MGIAPALSQGRAARGMAVALLAPWPGQRGSVAVAIDSEAFPRGTSSLSEIHCSMKCYFPVPSAQFTCFFYKLHKEWKVAYLCPGTLVL